MKQKIKRGDEVVVIAGAHKGSRGKVLQMQPTKDRILVEGVAMIKRHTKPTQDNQEGGIVEREASIHRSNVMPASVYDEKQKAKA